MRKKVQLWRITFALAVLLLAVSAIVCVQQKYSYESILQENTRCIAEEFASRLNTLGAGFSTAELELLAEDFIARWPIDGLVVLDSAGNVLMQRGPESGSEAVLDIPLAQSPGGLAPGGVLRVQYSETEFSAQLIHLAGLLVLCNSFLLLIFHGLLRLLQRRQHKAESMLGQQEERLRLALEASSDGIWENNLLENKHFFSDRMYSMLGYAPQDSEQAWRFVYERVHLEDREKLARGRELMLQGKRETLVSRFRMQRRDGEWRHILCRAKVVAMDMQGKPARIAGTFTDVTPLVDAEEALASLNRELEERVEQRTNALAQKAEELAEANRQLLKLDQLKSNFLSSVSHELRTPLTSILGFAKLISKEFANHFQADAATEREARASRRIQENLRIITSQGERLSRLVNDVLDLNKIESGMMEWRDEIIVPQDVMQRAIEATMPLLEGNPDVSFISEMRSDLPRITIDPDRLEQVLINLLYNAVKFTEAGYVKLKAERDESGNLLISVEDTGQGIPEHSCDAIFDKFHQLPTDALHGKPGGTGLGLFICREIIRHYNGKLWVESTVGQGSCFMMLLPPEDMAGSTHEADPG